MKRGGCGKSKMKFTRSSLIILLGIICAFSGVFGQYTSTLGTDLRTLLFTTNSYDRQSRPDDLVNITVQMNPIYMNDLNIVSQEMTVAAFISLSWSDSRLSWSTNPTYSTVNNIFSNNDETWCPAIIFSNSVQGIAILDDDSNPIRIGKSGTIRWTPIGVFHVHCDIDVTYYPFDSQACSIIISSWGYSASEVNLQWDTSPVDMGFFEKNGEWSYEEYRTEVLSFVRGPNTYSALVLYLKFKRRPDFQVMNTLTPCVMLSFLSCFIFKLPIESGEKMGYSLTVLLAYAVYLSMVSVNMPTTSIKTAFITLYLLTTLITGILMTGVSIFVLKFYYHPADKKVPSRLRNLCNGCLGRFAGIKKPMFNKCCSSKQRVTTIENEESKVACKDYEEENITWQDVAIVLDAAFFRISMSILVVIQAVFMLAFLIGWQTTDPFDNIQ